MLKVKVENNKLYTYKVEKTINEIRRAQIINYCAITEKEKKKKKKKTLQIY